MVVGGGHFVIPATAGPVNKEYMKQWIPACAGMTVLKFCKLQVPILCVARAATGQGLGAALAKMDGF